MKEPLQEPSVLDYVKSRLNPWRREQIEIPSPEESAAPAAQLASDAEKPVSRVLFSAPLRLPWRTALAFLLALYAQWTLEPPSRAVFFAVGLYTLAFGLLLWAYFFDEFSLPSAEEPAPALDPQTFGRNALIFAMLFGGIAFTLFGKNDNNEHLFNAANLTLWLASIVLFINALWLRDPAAPPLWKQALNWLKRDSWQVKITRGAILLAGVTALILFFRFYRLDGVIGEPFSDHAEKLLDVYDISQGRYSVFFERNTGREFIQFYWTYFLANLLGTGISFITLKIGTVLIGLLALPYIFLLGKEVGGWRVAFFALLMAGTAYWLNTISRIGLRFPLYPAFAAPVLYYLIRGLRRQNRNDFILSGLFLGMGMHGYSPFRFMPVMVVAAIVLYLLHAASKGVRKQTIMLAAILVLGSLLVFIPLMRYAIDRPDMFSYRTLTRLSGDNMPQSEAMFQTLWNSMFVQPQDPSAPGPGWKVLLQNSVNSMFMLNYDNGEIWVHSIPHRPALEFISAALFLLGYLLLFVRYLRRRDWLDLFFLLAVPLLMMPSSLSVAFPGENPSLNRTGAAAVVVFIIAGQALDGLYNSLRGAHLGEKAAGARRPLLALVVVFALMAVSVQQNYTLVFDTFAAQFMRGAWNTSDMGKVIRAFVAAGNPVENAWVVPYPYWVDTRLVGIQTGYPARDAALWPEDFGKTLDVPGSKMFIVKDEDLADLQTLRQLYPLGMIGKFTSPLEGKNFWIFTVPDSQPVPQP